ncbi:hypothetical protein [Methylobacter sp.]|uniref:hypothetical protein n=1 Tax=Methylobacter sp. TaxID=2051955 RepID=UPI002FDDC0C7
MATQIDPSRLEPMGINCELGFLLLALGCNQGSLFRWTYCSFDAALSLLRNDLNNIFDDITLAKHNKSMVLNKKVGIYFHASELAKVIEENPYLESSLDITKVTEYDAEVKKYSHLRQKFLERISDNKTIHFLTDPTGSIEHDEIKLLVTNLRRLGKPESSYTLIVKQSFDPDLIGTVNIHDDNVLLAYIDRFAPPAYADQISLDSWKLTLETVNQLILKNQKADPTMNLDFFTGKSKLIMKENTDKLSQIRIHYKLSFKAGFNIERYLLDGWSAQEDIHRWTDGGCAGLQFHLSELGTKNIIMRLECSAYLAIPNGELHHQTVEVLVNEKKVAIWEIRQKDWYEAVIPNGLVKNGSMIAKFLISNPSAPIDCNLSADTRKLGLRVFNLELIDSKYQCQSLVT